MHENIYTFHQYFAPERLLNVLMVGESICDSSYRIERAEYAHFVIEYTLDGEGALETNGQTYPIHAGDTYFLYRNRPHRYWCAGAKWIKKWIVLTGELAEAMFCAYLPERPDVLHGFDVALAMERILNLARSRDVSYEEMVDRIALEVHRILIRAKNYTPQSAQSLPVRIKGFIDENLTQPLQLDEMAQRFGYSKNHLINVFSTAYSLTPYAYYEKQKMLTARELLLCTSAPVSAISAQMGFDTPQYFSKRFKRYFGVTPSRLRKSKTP